jgi:hypothetical protein
MARSLENSENIQRISSELAAISSLEAETSKIVAILKEPIKVREINASYQLKIAELNAQATIQLSSMKFNGYSESARMIAEARTYADVKRALVAERILQNDAKTLAYLSEAENFASKLLESKRNYDHKLKSLATLKALVQSSKHGIVVSGNEMGSLQSQMLAVL